MHTTYRTFQVAIVSADGLRFLDVVACDAESARADVREAYGAEVDIASVSVR